ncbi:MAG: hypothetical protein R2797_08935 [Gelidibacter sp.]
MQLQQILKITLLVICMLFLGFQVFNLEFQAAGSRVILVLLLTVLYYIRVRPKRLLFFLFLLFFSLAEIVNFASWFIKLDYDTTTDYFYYGANILYIVSYVLLTLRVIIDMNIQQVLSKFWIHIIILTVLDVFCVIIVSGTAEKMLSEHQYSLEVVYNSVIMILLTVAMINYISKNSHKSMNLLLGAIFIFFSEVIQMTYFYISDINILNVICSLFLVLAFLFLYLQARIPLETEQNNIRQDLPI